MIVAFTENALAEFVEWGLRDRKVFQKIDTLLDACKRNPFEGIGKPEALRHDFKGHWSRRITDEHRLIYRVENNQILVISCKSHYDK